ncbi:BTAD domain-containing putative transcriptional regulator [Mesorhizobium sp. L-8-3]|uniref:BTAD domain-containing putative transcriptional regulator n=1 Tax=Mesorhizobium sp. L-8-3 TaxID=2744522 RepID=UPI0019279AED|nr:BTAD domain-containing putative transcriptional regulator [Mesorhizobium sp. L-8-3]
MWGDRDERQARASLRQALAEIRRAFGEPAVVLADRETITLDLTAIKVDAIEFEQLAAAGELERAAELYGGDLLVGLTLPEGGFADWLVVERTRLHDLAIEVLARLVASQSGEIAIKTAQRLLQFDPLREETHRALMRLYAGAGQRGQALRQFQICRDWLQRELGVHPELETEQLYREIQSPIAAAAVATERRGQPSVAIMPFDYLSGARDDYFVDRVVGEITSASGSPVKIARVGITPGLIAGLIAIVLIGVGALYAFMAWRDRGSGPPLAETPSLAVLPFANLSGDPGEEYFADGITDDLITDLAKLSGLVVIARNSVFAYKGRPGILRDVARDLDVRYVVEGSVRRSADRIHVNANLIDTATGDHLLVKEFDRNASDVFAIEEEVVRHIVEALGVWPTGSEQEQLARPPTANLEAYDYYLRGEQAARTGLLREALQLYTKATMLDLAFADAYAADARTAVDIWRNVFDDILPGPVARKRAYEKAGRALELNPESSRPYAILAGLQVVDRRYEEALVSARRAVALGPSDSEAHAVLSLVLTFSGRHADAVAAIESAQKFNPNLSMSERQVAGMAFLLHGDYVRAIETLERARAEALRGEVGISGLLAAAYARAGRLSEARAVAAEARRTTPLISIELWRVQYAHFRNGQDLERVLDAMREAGIPQWPFDFRGDDRDRLKGEDISRLALGRTWRGQTEAGESALLQFGRDGKTAFRTPTQIVTGTAFVDRDMLCEQSENVLLGRPRCGPVYRRTHGAGEPAYTYANAFTVFHFSPVE